MFLFCVCVCARASVCVFFFSTFVCMYLYLHHVCMCIACVCIYFCILQGGGADGNLVQLAIIQVCTNPKIPIIIFTKKDCNLDFNQNNCNHSRLAKWEYY